MRYSLFFLLSCLHLISFAKEKKQSKISSYIHQTTLRASLLNAGIGMPTHFVNGRLHPGIQLGIQKSISKQAKKSYIDYSFHLGYFAQQSLQRALYLKPGIGYNIHLYKRIMLRPVFSLPLMAVQQINDEFKLNNQGEYEQVNKMRFQLMPSLGMETSIPVAHSKQCQYNITLGYDFGLQLPFSVISSVLPINQLHIGVSISSLKK